MEHVLEMKRLTVEKSYRIQLLCSFLLLAFVLSSNVYAQNNFRPAARTAIQENVQRINEKTAWTRIETIDVEESTEGGQVVRYWSGDSLEKIVVRHFGETFQAVAEFYLLDGKLSFVFEKIVQYNRPIYYDSTAMLANNDTEAFDFDKSEIREIRSYVVKGMLVEYLDSHHPEAKFSAETLNEKATQLKSDWNRYKDLTGDEEELVE